jgi:fatty-acyl-CoA synthase
LQHPSVSEAAVIGVPDERWGERPLAVIVCRGATRPDEVDQEGVGAVGVTEDEIKAHVGEFAIRGVISRWAVPNRVLFVDSLDKTSVGKLDKKLMRQKYQ